MSHPRNLEDSEKLMRRAAVDKLRQAGVTVHRFRQNPQGIADAIRSIEPKFERTTNPMSTIRAYLGLGPAALSTPSRFVDTGRAYTPDRAMRIAMDRCKDQPKPISMLSKVSYQERDR